MRSRFCTQSFKIQAVEKTLKRSAGTTLKEISEDLGIGHSKLERWIVQVRDRRVESVYDQMQDIYDHRTKTAGQESGRKSEYGDCLYTLPYGCSVQVCWVWWA